MGLLNQTLILTAGIIIFSWLPVFSSVVRNNFKKFFYAGVGATVGICFLDLFPDILESGGKIGLFFIGVTLLAYTFFHGGKHKGHSHDNPLLFYVSLMVHTVASGMFLALSVEMPLETSETVFAALFVHKSYEALIFSFVLVNSFSSKFRRFYILSAYAMSLPFGVALIYFFRANMGENVPIIISSIGVGTLFGCLIYDFLIPSLRQIKTCRVDASWMLFGLLFSQLVLRGFVEWLH